MSANDGTASPPTPTWRIGDARITRIEEVSYRLPIEQFIPLAGAESRARHGQRLSPAQLDAEGEMTLVIGGSSSRAGAGESWSTRASGPSTSTATPRRRSSAA